MGISDRDYYRGEARGSLWFSGTAPVCQVIIAINVGVFLLENVGFVEPGILERWFAARSDAIFRHGHVWQLLTATFLHDGIFHILGNMLLLWFVGREMEAMYGSKDFAAFYLSACVVSTFGWALGDLLAGGHVPMMGASGATIALAVLYAMYYPRREVLFMFVFPVEIWILVVFFIVYQFLLLLRADQGGYAVGAHLTGAAYGALFKRYDFRLSNLLRFRRRRRFRVISPPEPREKTSSRPSPGPNWSTNIGAGGAPKTSASPVSAATTAVLAEEQLDARLDEILAKIAREGRGGLSDEENRVLQEASVRARNRRSDRV